MHDIINNQFGQQNIRIVMIEGEPWFVAMDVAEILGYNKAHDMMRHVRPKHTQKVKVPILRTLTSRYGNNDLLLVNEPGLYSAILGSKKPNAEQFQDWVTEEVIPAIRKTGGYSVQHQIPQTYAEALRLAADMSEKLDASQAVIEEQKPKIETYNEIMDLDYIYDMSTAVKMIDSATKLGVGRTVMFRILRGKKILIPDRWVDYKGNTHHKNQPYQQYVTAGYFIVRPGKNKYCQSQTFMTMRGVEFITHLLRGMSTDEISRYMARDALLRRIGQVPEDVEIHGHDVGDIIPEEPYCPDNDGDVEVDSQMCWDEEN